MRSRKIWHHRVLDADFNAIKIPNELCDGRYSTSGWLIGDKHAFASYCDMNYRV